MIPAAAHGPLLPGSVNPSPSSERRPGVSLPRGPVGTAPESGTAKVALPSQPSFFFPRHGFFLRFHVSRDGEKSTILWAFLPPSSVLHFSYTCARRLNTAGDLGKAGMLSFHPKGEFPFLVTWGRRQLVRSGKWEERELLSPG